MDAVKFIKNRNRMCNSMKSCSQCPFGEMNYCDFDTEDPEKLVALVEQWSQEHPQKTMMQDFFEKHPNAPKRRDGTPVGICPSYCGYTDEPNSAFVCEKFDKKCLRCWSRPME